MYRLAVLGLGLLTLSGCATATQAASGTVVEAAAVEAAPPAESADARQVEVVQGTVTKVEPDAGVVHVDVRLVWAPVLRAEHRPLEVSVGPGTRFVPAAFRGPLSPGDEVQVSVVAGADDLPRASEITVLDLE